MKKLIIPFLLLFLNYVAYSNAIDSLKTNADVNAFLIKKIGKDWKKSAPLSLTKDSLNFGENRFIKIDLNKDGLSDLLIEGQYFFAITDNGDNTYQTHWIDRGAFLSAKYKLVGINSLIDGPPLIVVKHKPKYGYKIPQDTTSIALVLNYGGFIEYNKQPDDLKINKIVLSTSGCFGSCPIFELTINENGRIVYNAIEYNKKAGRFESIIDGNTLSKIKASINYLDTKSLQNKYTVDWTDDQIATLEITYNNGIQKKVFDYGMIGTFGLTNLYGQLSTLRETLNWHKSPYYFH